MSFTLSPLPFAADALEPHMSERTLKVHHGKHHAGYVKKLNELVKGTAWVDVPLLDIVLATHGDDDARAIFENAAQAWNHSFFWSSMTPVGGRSPGKRLATMIDKAFGSYDALREEFIELGKQHFGSGWVWLVIKDEVLSVGATPNAAVPQIMGFQPLLACDVWEHAYYLDHQHRRERYLQTFIDKLVCWPWAEACLQTLDQEARDGAPARVVNAEGDPATARSFRRVEERATLSGTVEPATQTAAAALDGPDPDVMGKTDRRRVDAAE